MIFIFQDESKIKQAWLDKVAKLQAKLETLPDADARKAFIDNHSNVWGEIKNELLEMSHWKCWYSPPYTCFLLNGDMELNRNR